jgi:hypothetical protein
LEAVDAAAGLVMSGRQRAGLQHVWVGAKKRDSKIAVGPVIAHRPPHRSGRAQLRHPVLTLSI